MSDPINSPKYQLNDLSRDYIAIILAKYFRDKINAESVAYTGRKIIQSVRDYDDPDIQGKEYPALKVFKTSEQIKYYEKFFYADYTIRFELLLPEMNDWLGLLPWVAKIISKYIFTEISTEKWMSLFSLDPKSPGQIDYTIINTVSGEQNKALDYKIRIVYTLNTFDKILNN